MKYESRAATNSSEPSAEDPQDEYILPISLASSSFKDYKPSQGGSSEFFVLNTDIYSSNEEIIGIKLRAVDASGNLGPWSNVVIVKLNNKIRFSPLLRQANGAMSGSFGDDNSAAALSSESKSSLIKLKEDRYFYYFMIFIACLSLILLVQIVMIIILTLNKLRDARRTSKGKPKTEQFEPLQESMDSTESNPSLLIQRV